MDLHELHRRAERKRARRRRLKDGTATFPDLVIAAQEQLQFGKRYDGARGRGCGQTAPWRSCTSSSPSPFLSVQGDTDGGRRS